MNNYKDFIYKDYILGGYGKKWKRDTVHNIAKMFSKSDKEKFVTVQSFINGTEEANEKYVCSIFYDLDNDNDLQSALEDAKNLANYYVETYGMNNDDII